jgi:hypothetical protein
LLPVVDEGREKRDEMGEAIEMKRRREHEMGEERTLYRFLFLFFFF